MQLKEIANFSKKQFVAYNRIFLPVHFGPSRMRTETAALSAVYQHFLKIR